MDNRYWRIARRPVGTDFAAALELAEEDFAPLADGQIRIRNTHLSMDAGTRMWLTDREDGYQPPLPVGGPMTGLVLGEVVESRAEGFGEGDLVRAFGQWAEVSTVDAVMSGALLLDPTVADRRAWFGPLGMNGWTALWGGGTQTGAAKPGERVLVSAAAGATGILAVQIAKLLGCEAWGIVGGDRKWRYLKHEIGVTGVVDYKSGALAAQLDVAGGFDVYFDNVGGPLLDQVLTRMNHYGRIAVCGLLADYGGKARTAPREFDQVLMRRLRIEGFFSPDFMHEGPALTRRLREWTESGELVMPYDVTTGLENTLTAYAKLFTGANIGKVIVELTPMTGTLEDREAIRDILAAYAHAIDRRRWGLMERLFHPDATFRFGTIEGDWRGFVEQARAVINPCLATQHQLGQTIFGFDGPNTCHTETYMTAMHTIPPGYTLAAVFPDKGVIYSAIVAGRYVDRFEKRPGPDGPEWRLAQRTGLYDWREFRVVEGVDLSDAPEGAAGYHDERDPATAAITAWLG